MSESMRTPTDWDVVFMKMAEAIAERSKDPSTQVGSVIVSPDRRRVAVGYNGMIAGIQETDEMWQRPQKYSRVLHAEINSILNARCDLTGWTMYVTIPPCSDCAKYVAQAGVKKIVFKREPRPDSQLNYQLARELFESAGVEVCGPIKTS